MDTTYRFRFLIYVAAFMLVMSLCFAYAEPCASQNPLLLRVTAQHPGFLAPPQAEPSFDPGILRDAAPVVPSHLLQQLEQKSRPHHRFFFHSKQSLPQAFPSSPTSESSLLGLTLQPPAASSVR